MDLKQSQSAWKFIRRFCGVGGDIEKTPTSPLTTAADGNNRLECTT